jgi:SAM-dependent methyltransferase
MCSACSDKSIARYLEWDIATFSKILPVWGGFSLSHLQDGEVLEIGARNGGLSQWAADHGAKKVVCSDLMSPSTSVLALAQSVKYREIIQIEELDVTAMKYASKFDVVISKSVLGGLGSTKGIEDQSLAIAAIYQSLKKGGVFLFAENLTATRTHRALRRNNTWTQRWKYFTGNELDMLLRPFSNVYIEKVGVVACFGRNEFQRKQLSVLDSYLLQRVVPDSWKYLGFGFAIKN